MLNLKKFNQFLSEINLDNYRHKYQHVKCFEADMPKSIQALKSIYDVYWIKQIEPIPDFELFYSKYYWTRKMQNLVFENNQKNIGLCSICLEKGTKARIYRTWALLITQIQAAYCCKEIFGVENVFQNEELDRSGIDILIVYKKQKIGLQIKKQSARKEIANRKPLTKEKNEADLMYDLYYYVPNENDLKNPQYTKNTKDHKKGQWKEFAKLFGLDSSQSYLERLNNGFVIFTTKYFLDLKTKLDELF